MVQGIYTPSKKIVANSGVLGDLINYRSLHSPYNTVLCNIYGKKVTQLTVFHNVHLKIKKKKYSNQWPYICFEIICLKIMYFLKTN